MFLAPRQLPPLSYLLDDLPAAPRAVARHLGVSWRTLQRWIKREQAPRAALLALFFESRWGRSALDAKAVNDARVAHGLARALEGENAKLRERIAYLERVGQFGTANAPTFYASSSPSALAAEIWPRSSVAMGALKCSASAMYCAS